MINLKSLGAKVRFCLYLLVFPAGLLSLCPVTAAPVTRQLAIDEPQVVTLVEVRYEKLMRIYLNKIKLAFSETDDARSLEILNQFLTEFSQKTDGIKSELQVATKGMSSREIGKLYNRLSERSHTEELIALLFDERVTSRLAQNNELKVVMDQLHAKSLEVEKSEKDLLAAGK